MYSILLCVYILGMTKYYRLRDFNKVMWLNTKDAAFTDTDRKLFTFTIPNFELRDVTKMRISSASQLGTTDTNIYVIRVDGVMYNQTCYYSTDNRGNPIMLVAGFHNHQEHHQMNNELILSPQVINRLTLNIHTSSGGNVPVGTDFVICLIFDEMETLDYVEVRKELF